MADRSTAAVGVANDGGAALGGAADAATTSETANDAELDRDDQAAEPDSGTAETGTTESEQAPVRDRTALKEPPVLHSGHKLARRYRLEECVTRSDSFSSWRAVDEMLRRAVGVHVLPSDHSRAKKVLAAARSAALLGDPRFVQVLDAVEENGLVYVVHEWLPDATELTTLLAEGPLQTYEAGQMVRQLSEAMAAAHRKNLSHLKLDPHNVLRTESGQYRVRGLAVAAALHGVQSDHPQREDTEAIGALLYAALTQRWPYSEDAHGLAGLPANVGLVAPDQVRAGVHRGLSELAMRALVNDGSTASRQEPACATPEELAKAAAGMPPIPPPEPDLPTYQRTSYQQGTYRQPPARPPVAVPAPALLAPTPPPALPGRTGKALKWAVSALLIVALGLGSWQIADAFLHKDSSQDERNSRGSTAMEKGNGRNAVPLEITSAEEFAPLDSPIASSKVPLSIDGDKSTAWVTSEYHGYPNFGNLSGRKQGSGIIVDLGAVRTVSGLDITMYRPGQTVEVLAADASAQDSPTDLSTFRQKLTELSEVNSNLNAVLDKSVQTRYLLIHVTQLPSENGNTYRGGISEIRIVGEQ